MAATVPTPAALRAGALRIILARFVAVAAVCLLLVLGTYYALWSPADAHGETEQRFIDIWRRRSAASTIST